MTRPRFLADHDLNEHLVTGVVRLHPEIEFVRVGDVGLADASDLDVLGYASRMSLCVVSHDVNTMTAAVAATIGSAGSFPGLFMVRQTTPVRWLVAREDAATFIRFLDDEATLGIEQALARHYELSVDSLTSAWKEVAPISSLGLAERRR